MSPLSVRRYRAERLLRGEFEALRGRVLATVRRRLSASGVTLDPCDLEACYSQAWQGLYMAVLDGQEIANPAGWLVLTSFRRALEEHRSRRRRAELHRLDVDGRGRAASEGSTVELDLAAELDDRIRLRQLFEGLCAKLGAREREAAVLCYLQGLSRAEAAVRMGISEGRMSKLMEGRGPSRPGVAAKVGSLVETIREGGWCEQQGSLMRGFAFGILDPDGERRQLALMHSSECPACRAYVASLRGLAAVFPPVLLPFGIGAGVLAHVGGGAHALAGGMGAAATTPAAGSGAASGVARGIGGGLGAPAAGAGGAGAAGGGWLLAGGPVGAKLAVGCLLALGVGASCVELGVGGAHSVGQRPARRHLTASASRATGAPILRSASSASVAAVSPASAAALRPRASVSTVALSQSARAAREFGPEQGVSASVPARSAAAHSTASAARVAASGSTPEVPTPSTPATAPGTAASAPEGASKAAREFSPG